MFDCRPTKIALTLLVLASSARVAFIRLDVLVPNAILTESRAQQRWGPLRMWNKNSKSVPCQASAEN
jgi:hypothetical protein